MSYEINNGYSLINADKNPCASVFSVVKPLDPFTSVESVCEGRKIISVRQ